MSTIIPISQLPNGVVATTTELAAISVATVTENAFVTTLGSTSVGDGQGKTYFFKAGSSQTADNVNVVATPTTGRWVAVNAFSGVGPLTASRTGYAETFAIISGIATAVTYALPPTTNVLGKIVTVKSVTTGTVTIRCGNATDLIYDEGVAQDVGITPVASVTSTLTGGQAWNFLAPAAGRYYRIDKVVGEI